MQVSDFGHSMWLVAASLTIAVVAGATGFSLTKQLSQKTLTQRKIAVALASVAFGGGIWSMHFVAMLGLKLPFLFYYDAAITLGSALIAILVCAIGLMLLHFTPRTPAKVVLAGAIMGCGIVAMHYIGMSGMQLCSPSYSLPWVAGTSVLAVMLCVVAVGVAYGVRSDLTIIVGTICFGIAVFCAHFLAMFGTTFTAETALREFGPLMSNETLAVGVVCFSFVICGAFLWVGVTFLMPPVQTEHTNHPEDTSLAPQKTRVPCERGGTKIFIAPQDIAFVRADGHYTQVYTATDKYFCVWPITEAAKRLTPQGFIQTHRSYLLNTIHVDRFERGKDKGKCLFPWAGVPAVPVSRSHLKDVEIMFT